MGEGRWASLSLAVKETHKSAFLRGHVHFIILTLGKEQTQPLRRPEIQRLEGLHGH